MPRQFLSFALPQCVFLTPIIHFSMVKQNIFLTFHHTTNFDRVSIYKLHKFLFWFCAYCLHPLSPAAMPFKLLLCFIQYFILSASCIASVLPCISSKALSIHYVLNPRIVFNALKGKLILLAFINRFRP